MKPTILVIGATGMLGEPVARQLQRDGYAVRVLARSPEKARAKLGSSFEIVPGDVEDPASLERALTGCAGVHVNLRGGPRPEEYDRIEHLGAANVARAAATAGVERLTYLSGAPVSEENFHDPGTRAKFHAEAAVRASGVPYTIFRATWIMESLPLFIRGKRAIVIGRQPHLLHWVAAGDYAQMVSQAYRLPEAANKTLYIYGPEKFSKPEALEIYCSLLHPDVKVTFIPIWLMSLVGKLSFNAELQQAARWMAFYEHVGDDYGDPTEANELLGVPVTTLAQWCKAIPKK